MKLSDFDKRDERLEEADRRRAELCGKTLGGGALLPWTTVALGAPASPVERMIGLQCAFYRLVVIFETLRWRKAQPEPDPRNIARLEPPSADWGYRFRR